MPKQATVIVLSEREQAGLLQITRPPQTYPLYRFNPSMRYNKGRNRHSHTHEGVSFYGKNG